MTEITLERIQAKQTELAALIQQFTQATQPVATLHVFPEVEIELQPGERYAGPVLDADGKLLHHLVLMAQRPAGKLNWQAAMDWAATVVGALPTRQEQALLYANCKPHLDPLWHWSCETHEDDASYAWHCYFGYGNRYGSRKSFEGSAVAVRRV